MLPQGFRNLFMHESKLADCAYACSFLTCAECRNNTMPSYEPKGADVWSLGIVLLNLLFHRCPWADPTLDDPDYSAFNYNPVKFLETRFQGIGNEVATFLATKVFCEIDDSLSGGAATPDVGPKRTGTRVSAGEFGKWAKQLVRYMGEGSRRASISEATVPLVSAARHSPRLDDKRTLYSPQVRSPRHSLQLSGRDGDVHASPSRLKPLALPSDLVKELSRAQINGNHDLQVYSLHHLDPITPVVAHQEQTADEMQAGQADTLPTVANDNDDVNAEVVENADIDDRADAETNTPAVEGAEAEDGEADKERKERHRRRKRGARRPKPKAEGEEEDSVAASPSALESRSPARSRSGTVIHAPSSELNITEASQSIQALAREMSKVRPSVSANVSPVVEPVRPTKSRFSDRFKGAFANGNQDLQAFQQRARERDMALTGGKPYNNPTASAPAKLQHSSAFGVGSGVSSFGSVASAGSWSEDAGTSSHWASTGSRRERQKQQHSGSSSRERNDEGQAGHSSRPSRRAHGQHGQTRSSSLTQGPPSTASSPSRGSYSPMSSFSSSTSYGGVAGAAARSPLQSIEEKITKESPPTTAATVRPPPFEIRHSEPLLTHAIREPLPPPLDLPPPVAAAPASPAANKAGLDQQQASAGKAKFGRLFKFSRA